MQVQKISDTIQKFDGISYYKCGPYFQRKGIRLHRKVWEYHNGEIPEGYDIHHKDHDRNNNDISNLQMILKNEHYSQHMKEPERIEKSRQAITIAHEAANKWHGSQEGIVFHSELGKENWKKRKSQEYTCTFCGKKYSTLHIYGEGQNHFCSNNCKAAYRRRRVRNGEIPA